MLAACSNAACEALVGGITSAKLMCGPRRVLSAVAREDGGHIGRGQRVLFMGSG